MKVLYFIEEARLGGPQVQMARVASALGADADIEILMPRDHSEAFRQLCEGLGVRYRVFAISRLTRELGALATFLLRSPLEVLRLTRYVSQTRPDLIHAWGGSWQIKAALVSRLTGVPLVWLINDTKVPAIVTKVFRRVSRLASGFIFASHRSAEYYHPHIPGEARTTVVQSLVDTGAFDPGAKFGGDEDLIASFGDSTVVGVIANINPVKGLETFIRVAGRARAANLNTRFVIVGQVFPSQHAYFEQLKELTRSLGASNVVFAGARQEVRPLLSRFDIYLCTSLAESSPVAVWEAMAMGKPIVSTDVGDVPRFVKNGESGSIAAVEDDAALFTAVERLSSDSTLAAHWGATARRVAEASFSKECIAGKTMAFYLAVTEGDGGCATKHPPRSHQQLRAQREH